MRSRRPWISALTLVSLVLCAILQYLAIASLRREVEGWRVARQKQYTVFLEEFSVVSDSLKAAIEEHRREQRDRHYDLKQILRLEQEDTRQLIKEMQE